MRDTNSKYNIKEQPFIIIKNNIIGKKVKFIAHVEMQFQLKIPNILENINMKSSREIYHTGILL